MTRDQVIQRALRYLVSDIQQRDCLSSPQAVKDFLKLKLAGRPHEVFMVLFLDSQNRLIAAEEMFRGTLTQTSVYPREVIIEALARGAAGVVLAHNHPSGVSEPSGADLALTEVLRRALGLVDIRVLDHVVVAGPQTVSLAERGLI